MALNLKLDSDMLLVNPWNVVYYLDAIPDEEIDYIAKLVYHHGLQNNRGLILEYPRCPRDLIDKTIENIINGRGIFFHKHVCKNPNLTEDDCEKIWNTKNNSFSRKLLDNPNLPEKCIREIYNNIVNGFNEILPFDDGYIEATINLWLNPSLPDDIIEEVMTNPNFNNSRLYIIYRNPNLPRKYFSELLDIVDFKRDDKNDLLKKFYNLTINPNLKKQDYIKLFHMNNNSTRFYLSYNRELPSEIIDLFLSSSLWSDGFHILKENINLTKEQILQMRSRDEGVEPYFQEVGKFHPAFRD